MFKTVSKVYLLVLILTFTGCTNDKKSSNNDIDSAVLEKITNAVKNQVLFQKIMLDDYVVKQAAKEKVILAYSLHPKYFYWKAKDDPAMNFILSKVDEFVDKLNIRLSDIKQVESNKDNIACTCSANISMGQEKMAIKYTVTDAENGKLVIRIKDSIENELPSHGSQPIRGSLFALCNTWENIKPTTFPPANPQIIANYDDTHTYKTTKPDVRFGTIMPLDIMVDGNVSNNELRNYKILQKQRSASNTIK